MEWFNADFTYLTYIWRPVWVAPFLLFTWSYV